jgi:uncharacterized membrane protein HdeD (DUF308 family)
MLDGIYLIIVYFLIFLVILATPMTIVSKYYLKNKTMTQFFAFLGSISLILVIILVWDYIPD